MPKTTNEQLNGAYGRAASDLTESNKFSVDQGGDTYTHEGAFVLRLDVQVQVTICTVAAPRVGRNLELAVSGVVPLGAAMVNPVLKGLAARFSVTKRRAPTSAASGQGN